MPPHDPTLCIALYIQMGTIKTEQMLCKQFFYYQVNFCTYGMCISLYIPKEYVHKDLIYVCMKVHK